MACWIVKFTELCTGGTLEICLLEFQGQLSMGRYHMVEPAAKPLEMVLGTLYMR